VTDPRRSRRAGDPPSRVAARVLLAAIATLAGSVAARAAARPISVSYVSATAVYLDAGRAEGVALGNRYRLTRSGDKLGEVEVAFLAEHSASCRILSQTGTARPGDVAELAQAAPASAASAPAPAPQVAPPPPPAAPQVTVQTPYSPSWTRPNPSWGRVYGSLSFNTQRFSASDSSAPGYDQSAARLSLHARDIDGLPLDLHIRLRAQQNSPTGPFSSSLGSLTTERLYEVSLTYDPPEDGGRFAFQLGRIAASPFVGLPYLDGLIGQVRMVRHWYSGLFYGKRPEIENLDLKTSGQRYGLFLRFDDEPRGEPRYSEATLALVGDYLNGHQLDREYVSLEGRFGNGSRWSFYERAEVDLNRDYRLQMTGRKIELSNVVVASAWTLTEAARLSVSYDRRRNVPTAEDVRNPEDVFIDLLNDGLSGTLFLGRPIGLNLTLSAGLRRESASQLPVGVSLPPSTRSYGASLYDNNVGGLGLALGLDAQLYQGGFAQGNLAMFRIRKYFTGGDDIGLLVGQSVVEIVGIGGRQTTHWARLSGTIELPWRLYLLSELEYARGGSLAGRRWLLELGYRF